MATVRFIKLRTVHIVTKIVRLVHGECSPTKWLMEYGALFHKYSRKHEARATRKTALVRISSTSRQKFTHNNRSRTINSSQRLTADQLALRTKLKRDHLVWAPWVYRVFREAVSSHGIL
ncbi:hypothetical protein AVEN_203402-1 [Araneus ventricosus]|uniref:Uncharacterized protein n=1 Tax=Araneus ventricosus TaxID=182803 RepID=A0A4Y2RMN0_ARAVE|nr:hypothetical protein AVEN_257306-1 [Araneus ventricosus]GBN76221.1 hypothetical protein AVEN_203402-1 [Araneus ventricosus]